MFGRWTKQETLLDPDDVSAGHVLRLRRARSDRIVRSRVPAHPAIVSVQNFVDVQLLRRSRGGAARPTLERSRTNTSHPYALGGRVRCGYCQRRMEGAARRWGTYYRCVARTLVSGSPVFAGQPKSVYLPEVAVLGPVNQWLGDLFDPDNLDRTVAALLASQGGDPGRTAAGQRLKEAETRLRRFQAAIAINQALALRTAAQNELDCRSAPMSLTEADVRAMVGALGDIGDARNRAEPTMLGSLYEALRMEAVYDAETRVSGSPSVQHMWLRLVSEGGLEHRRRPYRRVSASPAKPALTKRFTRTPTPRRAIPSNPVLTGPLANGLQRGGQTKIN